MRLVLLLLGAATAWGQGFAPLKTATLPTVPGLDRYVRDRTALVVLGKALFWDMQVGSDGRTACGSCHFHAGADHRGAGSIGVLPREFVGLTESPTEIGAGDGEIRQVTPRNAPTVFNAVFGSRLFHDGRAGSLDEQAKAPPRNTVEMSYAGRTWNDIARKLLPARPLATQTVSPDDSVLGPFVDPCCRGLARVESYDVLVRAAFQPTAVDDFSVVFGLAIQAYESTLVADDTPFDRFLAGQRDAMTPKEISGFLVFQTRAFCQFCHSGPELTTAGRTFTASHGPVDLVLSRAGSSLVDLWSDTGFFRTGVQKAGEDAGLGGTGISAAAASGKTPLAIDGAFKVPGLRNVEFTGPYFHNGGRATLEEVIEFYTRGSDFPESSGLPVEIGRFPLTESERSDLLAFLKSLTDDRVRYERAPFDHPELCVPVGDAWAGIPAVGRQGNAVPLQTFEELLNGVDGARAHTLKEACGI